MVEKVTIIKKERSFKVRFPYNEDLIDIMREYDGWYFKNDKSWTFPLYKLSEIRDELIHEMYQVEIKREKT